MSRRMDMVLRKAYLKLTSKPLGGPLEIAPAALARAEAETPATPPAYGAELDLLVRAAALNPRPRGAGAEYDRIKPHFDAAYYFAQNRDIAAKRIDPVWHYIKAGAREGRDPHGQFSTRAYLRRYPDVETYRGTPFDHWIRIGRAEGRAGTPAAIRGMDRVLGMSDFEILEHHGARQADLRERLVHGELGRMVVKAAEHDPTVMRVWPAALRLRVLPFSSTRITERIAALYDYQAALGWARARVVLMTEGDAPPSKGFLRLLETAVASEGAEQVVVLQTGAAIPEPWPDPAPGLRVLHLEGQYRRHPADNVRLLADLLRSLRPAAVISEHSTLFGQAMRNYGLALRAVFNVAMFPPPLQQTALGFRMPTIETMLYRTLPMTDRLICPDATARKRLIAAHHLDDDARARLTLVEHLATPRGFAALLAPRPAPEE